MSNKMNPGEHEHTLFMSTVLKDLQQSRAKMLNRYKDDSDRGVADGWFIATLISLAITLGKMGGLNNTQIRAIFEMYLDQIDSQTDKPLDPKTLIHKA